MSRVGLLVEFSVSKADAPALHAALAKERDAVAAGEPGCVLFEVLLWNEAGTEGAILELYEDQSAREAHRATPWLAEIKRVLVGLDVTLARREGPALAAAAAD